MNTINAREHERNRPLATCECEARARLALQRGYISQAVYRSLIWITTEVLLDRQAEDGAISSGSGSSSIISESGNSSGSCSDAGGTPTAPKKNNEQVTPCDTPPRNGSDESSAEEETYQEKSASSSPAVSSPRPEGGYRAHDNDTASYAPGSLELALSRDAHELLALRNSAASAENCRDAAAAASKDDKNNLDESSKLEKMRMQGFGPTNRLQGFGLSKRAHPYSVLPNFSADEEAEERRLLRFADICIKGFVPKCTAMLPKEAVVGSELSISQTGDLSGLITTSCIPPRQIAGSMQKPDDDDANKEEISLEESPLPPQTPLTTCPIVQPGKPINAMPLKRKAPSSEDANANKKKKRDQRGRSRRMCTHPGCTSHSYNGGIGPCVKHGAKVKTCSVAGCNNNKKRGGVCCKHGAKLPLCQHDGCEEFAKQGGRCN